VNLLSWGLLACTIAILLPQSGSPQDATSRLHMVPAKDVSLTADSIIRQDSPKVSNVSPYASEVQLKGTLKLRCVAFRKSCRRSLRRNL